MLTGVDYKDIVLFIFLFMNLRSSPHNVDVGMQFLSQSCKILGGGDIRHCASGAILRRTKQKSLRLTQILIHVVRNRRLSMACLRKGYAKRQFATKNVA